MIVMITFPSKIMDCDILIQLMIPCSNHNNVNGVRKLLLIHWFNFIIFVAVFVSYQIIIKINYLKSFHGHMICHLGFNSTSLPLCSNHYLLYSSCWNTWKEFNFIRASIDFKSTKTQLLDIVHGMEWNEMTWTVSNKHKYALLRLHFLLKFTRIYGLIRKRK